MKSRKAVFLDRDGVINKPVIVDGRPFAPRKFSEFELIPNVDNALKTLSKHGFLVIIVTNQPDVARGLIEIEELNKMSNFMIEYLELNDIVTCLHDDRHNCDCRKPKPGMLIAATKKWKININDSFMIGDTWKDIDAGKTAGCRTILINASYNKGVVSDYRADSLEEAVDIIVDGRK